MPWDSEGYPYILVIVRLDEQGEIVKSDEILLSSLIDRGYKYSVVEKGEDQIIYRVWDALFGRCSK